MWDVVRGCLKNCSSGLRGKHLAGGVAGVYWGTADAQGAVHPGLIQEAVQVDSWVRCPWPVINTPLCMLNNSMLLQ